MGWRMLTTLPVLLLLLAGPLCAEDDPAALGGGGPTPSILFLRLEPLNSALAAAGYPRITEVFLTLGGSGLGGSHGGVRVGGTGASGATTARDGERSVRLSLDLYGLFIEKVAGVEDDLTVVLGAMLGGGNLDLRLIHRVPDTFEDAVGTPYLASMSKRLYAVEPYVAFETQPFSWLATRLQFGLLWTLTDRWTFEDAEFSGPPRTMTGLVASLTLRFGPMFKEHSDDVPPSSEVVGPDRTEDGEPEQP